MSGTDTPEGPGRGYSTVHLTDGDAASKDYAAPYPIARPVQVMPDGTFSLPVCTTIPRLHATLSALNSYNVHDDPIIGDHIIDLLDAMARVDDCCDNAAIPITVPALDERIRYIPGDPRADPPITPPGYNTPVWSRAQPVLGYRDTDVIGRPDIDVTGGLDLIAALIASGIPRIEFDLSGTGIVDIRLLRVVQGGVALVVVDGIPQLEGLVDTSLFALSDLGALAGLLDLLGFAVTATDLLYRPGLSVRVEINDPGDHTIQILSLPRLSADILSIGWGLGLREIEIRGFVREARIVELRQSPDDNCVLQARRSGCVSWSDVFDYSLCQTPTQIPEDVLTTIDSIEVERLVKLYDESDELPSAVDPSAPDDVMADPQDPLRVMALCLALDEWMRSYARAKIAQIVAVAAIEIAITTILSLFFRIPRLLGVGALLVKGVEVFAAIQILSDDELRREVKCQALDALIGQPVSQAALIAAFDADQDGDEGVLAAYMRDGATSRDNWIVFIAALGRAYNAAVAGVSDCDCLALSVQFERAASAASVGEPHNVSLIVTAPGVTPADVDVTIEVDDGVLTVFDVTIPAGTPNGGLIPVEIMPSSTADITLTIAAVTDGVIGDRDTHEVKVAADEVWQVELGVDTEWSHPIINIIHGEHDAELPAFLEGQPVGNLSWVEIQINLPNPIRLSLLQVFAELTNNSPNLRGWNGQIQADGVTIGNGSGPIGPNNEVNRSVTSGTLDPRLFVADDLVARVTTTANRAALRLVRIRGRGYNPFLLDE